jgi:hypothetical protein
MAPEVLVNRLERECGRTGFVGLGGREAGAMKVTVPVAAIAPSRHAAKLNVLQAVTTE